jgi:hypothetical protein
MNNDLLRLGAVAAVAGAAAQLIAWALEPELADDPAKAIRVVAGNDFWTGGRLLDLIGVFLTVAALTLVGRTLGAGAAREWARVGQPLLVLMGALGASGIAVGAIMKDLANAWDDAGPDATHAYLATFDAAGMANEALVWCALLALALYLATLAVGILSGPIYARWIGWAAAASAVMLLAGDLLELVVDAAFIAVLAGFALFLVTQIALGVSMWRRITTPVPTGVTCAHAAHLAPEGSRR